MGKGPIALAVGAGVCVCVCGGGGVDIFSLINLFSLFFFLSGRLPDID